VSGFGHPDLLAAEAVLAAHLVVIGFNIFGLIAIPLGARLGWRFVRIGWWRWLHLGSMAVVALQALAGRACLLTILQGSLSGRGAPEPLIMSVVNRLIFWPLPLWAFTAIYLALFLYVVLLMRFVPPSGLGARRRRT
jgi:hypothetical protein